MDQGHPQVPTNVTRLSRAILPEDDKDNPQVVYYQPGLGSGWSVVDNVVGGGLAFGLAENIRAAYGFLAHNYVDKHDQIFLIGFSRGAFTARSVGGMISKLGLLTKTAMDRFYDIFEDYEHAGLADYTPRLRKELGITQLPGNAGDYLHEYKDKLKNVSSGIPWNWSSWMLTSTERLGPRCYHPSNRRL